MNARDKEFIRPQIIHFEILFKCKTNILTQPNTHTYFYTSIQRKANEQHIGKRKEINEETHEERGS